ncbi:g11253 [Coccomyxa elongata]
MLERLQAYPPGAQGLLPLVQAVVSSYADYHRRRLETLAAHDARLKFEMETLLNDSGSSADIQLLTSATRVILVVPIGTGMDCQCLAGLPSTAEDCPSAAHLQSLEQNMKLKVSWSLSASGVSDAVPVRQLLLPSQLGQLLGKVELPSWPSHGLGEPAEFDETTCSTASYSLKVEEEAWLVSVDLTNAFPEQKPRLTIQGGSAGECKAVDQGAWDPRWNAQEMALKIAKVVRSCV